MLYFLLSVLTQYSSSICIETYRAIQVLMGLFFCKMSNFVCIYLLYFFLFTITIFPSSWYILYTYDSFNISLIELFTHSEGTKYLCTQFQFLCVEVQIKYWSLRIPSYGIVHLKIYFFSHLNILSPIKSMFSMDFTSLFWQQQQKTSFW